MEIQSVEYFDPGDLLANLIVKDSCDLEPENARVNAMDEANSFVRPWSGIGPVEMIETR
jgi:hypothetical protein